MGCNVNLSIKVALLFSLAILLPLVCLCLLYKRRELVSSGKWESTQLKSNSEQGRRNERCLLHLRTLEKFLSRSPWRPSYAIFASVSPNRRSRTMPDGCSPRLTRKLPWTSSPWSHLNVFILLSVVTFLLLLRSTTLLRPLVCSPIFSLPPPVSAVRGHLPLLLLSVLPRTGVWKFLVFFLFDFGDDQWPSVSSFEKFENIFGWVLLVL